MKERVRAMIEYIPFIGLAVTNDTTKTPLFTKLIETAVMSGVAALVATYVGVELLKKDVESLAHSIEKVELKVDSLDAKVERKLERVDEKFDRIRPQYPPKGVFEN